MQTLNQNTQMCMTYFQANVPELTMTTAPVAAMYIMVKIQFQNFCDIFNDGDFSQKLLEEENLSVLPGMNSS